MGARQRVRESGEIRGEESKMEGGGESSVWRVGVGQKLEREREKKNV